MCNNQDFSLYNEPMKELKRKNASLQAQLDAANAIINSLSGNGVLNIVIEDLYSGEQKDFILSILEQVKIKCLPGSRPYEILDSILAANNKTGVGDKLAADVWDIIGKSSKIGEREISKLNDLGFKYVSSKRHPKLKFCDRYLFVLPSTPGDKRHGLKNLASEISSCIATSFKI